MSAPRYTMSTELLADVIRELTHQFGLKAKKDYLRGGKCPDCGKPELYANASAPWVIRCGRLKNCGYEASVKDLFPDLFEDWSERYKKTDDHPHAAADAYLKNARGFNVARVRGTYTQEWFKDLDSGATSATVRFALPGGGFWERLIDRAHRFGKMKARFAPGKSYAGEVWIPPTVTGEKLATLDKVWIVEGIFDAVAVGHHGVDAVSAMSCNNYRSRRDQRHRPDGRARHGQPHLPSAYRCTRR